MLRHIYALVRLIQPYYGIFKNLCNFGIFGSLPYSESLDIYIQNFVKAYSGIFQTFPY